MLGLVNSNSGTIDGGTGGSGPTNFFDRGEPGTTHFLAMTVSSHGSLEEEVGAGYPPKGIRRNFSRGDGKSNVIGGITYCV